MAWSRRRRALALAIGVLFVGYLAWMIATSKRTELRAIRAVAAPFLQCDPAKIEIGWGSESGDNNSEHEVQGCGRKGMVSCTDWSSRHGTLGQYFRFEFECYFHAPLPSGGFDKIGRREPPARSGP